LVETENDKNIDKHHSKTVKLTGLFLTGASLNTEAVVDLLNACFNTQEEVKETLFAWSNRAAKHATGQRMREMLARRSRLLLE